MNVTKNSKNKKKKVSSSGYIAKAIPHGMIQIGTADDGTKIYSASALIVKLYFPELYKLKPGLTNYIFTGKNGKYTPVRLSDNSYDKFINKDLLRTSNYNIQKEQKELEVTTYSNNTPAANPYNVDDVTLKELLKKLDWFDHGRQLWLDEQDAKVRKTAPSNHPWQLAFGTVLPAAIASSFATAPLATTAGFITFPYASLVFNDIWSNMNRPLPINGVNIAYVDGKYVDLGNFTPHQLLPKEAQGKTWDEQVSSGLQKLGMSKENADAVAPFSNPGGIIGAGFASNATRPVDAAITNWARSRGYAFTPTRYNFRPTGGMTKGNTTTMYPATPDYNINYTTSSTFNPKYVFSKIGETNKEGVTSAMVNAYAEAVAKGDRLTALKLLEEAYKRSGVPKSEITFDTNGNPQAWYHGTKYGNHTIFLAGKTTSTNGGLQAAELGLKRGTHLTTELESANSYANGPRDFNEIPKTLQPKTFIEKLKSKLNLFKERRLLPAERVDYTGQSLKPSRTYTTKEGPVIDYLPETNSVVYPMYVNPGINPRFMDFQGRSWANAPYNFSNDFIVSEYIKDDALRTFRDNIVYKGPDKNLAYTLFNEHPYTKDNGWKQASDIENEYFEFGNRRIQNYSPSKDYLQIELIETVVPSNINGAIHDAARNGNTALKIENIKDSNVLKNNKQYPIAELITFKPELLKIADITYDPTTGKLIPLNERFNWNNPNSLYSKIGDTNREGLLGGISSLKPNEAMLFGEDLVFNYLGSNRHINQIMKSGINKREATNIAGLLYTNATRAHGELVDPKDLIEPTDMGSYNPNLVYDRHLGLTYDPKYKVANDLYNEDIVTTVGHELGGHGATYSIIGKTIPEEELPVVKRYFPSYKLVAEHNIKLKPLRKPEYANGASDAKTEKLIKYLENPEEYTAVARSYHITDSPAVLDDLYEFFTKESVDNLVNNVWSKVGDVNKEGVTSAVASNSTKSKIAKHATLIDKFKNSNWYNFYFGKKWPIDVTITEPGLLPTVVLINNKAKWLRKIATASGMLKDKVPGTTLTISGLPGKMKVEELPQITLDLTNRLLLPRIRNLNRDDFNASHDMIDKMKKVVVIDRKLLDAADFKVKVKGFARTNSSAKNPNTEPIGLHPQNGEYIPFSTWIHELRHKLQQVINLTFKLKNLLKKAYKKIPKHERESVNSQFRSQLLKKHIYDSQELLDAYLDLLVNNPNLVLDLLEFLNGYGLDLVGYIARKHPNNLTREVQNMINAMKYVPLVEPSDKVLEAIPTLNSNKNL